jgi:hypothetical protein
MKVFHCGISGRQDETNAAGVLDRLGLVHHKQGPVDILVQAMKPVLDNRFIMLCEVGLEDQAIIFPAILIGPTGIWLISPTEAKGMYKISDFTWEILDQNSGNYKPDKQNPMRNLIDNARILADHLGSLGIDIPPIEPVVYFSSPGAHADTHRPAVRIVFADGLTKFITSILKSKVVLDWESIQLIRDDLLGVRESDSEIEEIKDAFSLQELPPPKKPREPTQLELMSREEPKIVGRLSTYLPFSRKQWLFIGILIVVNVIILLFLVLVVVVSV